MAASTARRAVACALLSGDPVGVRAQKAEGQIRVFTEGGNTIVQANNDGDLLAEGEIQLTGVFNLAADDFIL